MRRAGIAPVRSGSPGCGQPRRERISSRGRSRRPGSLASASIAIPERSRTTTIRSPCASASFPARSRRPRRRRTCREAPTTSTNRRGSARRTTAAAERSSVPRSSWMKHQLPQRARLDRRAAILEVDAEADSPGVVPRHQLLAIATQLGDELVVADVARLARLLPELEEPLEGLLEVGLVRIAFLGPCNAFHTGLGGRLVLGRGLAFGRG